MTEPVRREMDRDKALATVLLNTVRPGDELFSISSKGVSQKSGQPESIFDQILRAKVPMSTEFLRKVKVTFDRRNKALLTRKYADETVNTIDDVLRVINTRRSQAADDEYYKNKDLVNRLRALYGRVKWNENALQQAEEEEIAPEQREKRALIDFIILRDNNRTRRQLEQLQIAELRVLRQDVINNPILPLVQPPAPEPAPAVQEPEPEPEPEPGPPVAEPQPPAPEPEPEEDLEQEMADLMAGIDAFVVQHEADPPPIDNLMGLMDDVQQRLLNDGYTEDERNTLIQFFREANNRDLVIRFLDNAPLHGLPIPVQEIINNHNAAPAAAPAAAAPAAPLMAAAPVAPGLIVPAPPAGPLVAPVPPVAAPVVIPALAGGVVGDPAVPPPAADPVEPGDVNENAPQVIGTGSTDKNPYKVRYHETSLKLFFQNSSYPAWDHILESNILGLEISKDEIVDMMESVIREFGSKIFVHKRKSETLVELNELVQLQFCILRNLHIGDRSRTAQVKLSDLTNLQRAAAGANQEQQNLGDNQTNQPLNRVLDQGPAQIQTKTEFEFIKNYDRLQTVVNLSRTQNTKHQFAPQIRKTLGSAQSLGIYPGNNKQSALNDKKAAESGPPRIIKSKNLIRG